MKINFTEEQRQVIDLRNCNILVSAAAGSGKTSVLVERIITRLTKDENPLNVDELLIVTFTEAAAAEMKAKIHQAIEDALKENPENEHLQKQATLIHHAQINTIHKFCLSVIRDYFHTIDLDPGFRVGDPEGEIKLLKQDVVESVLEEAYAEESPEFLAFVEQFAAGKYDKKLEDMILNLYKISESYPNPERFLKECTSLYEIQSEKEVDSAKYAQMAVKEAKAFLTDSIEMLRAGLDICQKDDGPWMYQEMLEQDIEMLTLIRKRETYSEMKEAVSQIKWKVLSRKKDGTVSERKRDRVKKIRNKVKGIVEDLVKGELCRDDTEEVWENIKAARESVEVLVGLTEKFSKSFSEAKRDKNIIDYGDMEKFALKILTEERDGVFYPSATAAQYKSKFKEIMIDEYQDSNRVQEEILTAVSGISEGRYNIFMVGDVKQSIYRFRLSRPELFMEKYNTYSTECGDKRRIDLFWNFRSRREVLESTNYLFRQTMAADFGKIEYDDNAALHVGAEDYPENEDCKTELLLVDLPKANAKQRMKKEACAIALRIRKLKDTFKVYDRKKGTFRDLRYGDIAILSRNLKGWSDVMSKTLREYDIPAVACSKTGYFETTEVRTILSYLQVLDNPRQDIPLATVLSSMIGGFTNEELAQIKILSKYENLYDSVKMYQAEGDDRQLRDKVDRFLEQMNRFRRKVPYTPIYELLWQILKETGYDDYAAALPRGAGRKANLDMLIQKAMDFAKTSYQGLFQFVRYIEQLRKYDIDYGEAETGEETGDAVSLMSIHKSKGLEFPVVIVAGMSKAFNMSETRSSVVTSPELGIGIDAIDSKSRTKTSTLIKEIITRQILNESTAEELRVLYVAMTRAKEKLILAGTVTDWEWLEKGSSLAVYGWKKNVLPYFVRAQANCYLDWVYPAVTRGRKNCPIEIQTVTEEELEAESIRFESHAALTRGVLRQLDENTVCHEPTREHLTEQFSYVYPFSGELSVKQVLSVSELKKKGYEEAEGVPAFPEEDVIPLLPKFLQKEEQGFTGAARGSAYHKLLEVLDFAKDYDETSLETEMDTLVEQGYLPEDMRQCIRKKDILKFLQSPIGKRTVAATRKGTYHAEQPFVLGVEARRIYAEAPQDEMVMVQGIIDVYFEEDGELVVLDYKTDRVDTMPELVDRYHAQLEYYGEALERLTGMKVKERVIYSFALGEEVQF